jgi:glycosyltransferase involved in cell wall biosynthesis
LNVHATERATRSQSSMTAHGPARVYINGRFLQQPITGVQRYGRELLKAWDRLLADGDLDGVEIEFVVLAPRGPIDAPKLERIALRQAGRLRGHLWTQFELPILSRDGLLFSPGNIHPLFSLARLNGVVTVHDLAYVAHPEAYSKAFRLLYSVLVPIALRRAEAVITVSQAEKAHIIGHYPHVLGRIHAVHNGAAHGYGAGEPCEPTYDPSEERPFVLWVGTLIRRKNPQGALDAMALVNREMPVDLILAGATHRGLLEGGLRLPPELQRRARFLGQLDNFARLQQLYEHAAALIFPSFYESCGLPPLEAMQLGCPVVASDIPALREVCGDAALYANPGEPADIARKINLLLRDPPLRQELRERGHRQARLFSWDKCARETVAILANVLNGKPQRRAA